MPTSTEKGFSLSKWESKYLYCRYRAHRNKVAAAKPVIDVETPPERPHVRYKNKKALAEERRQIRIIHENLRVLNKTAEIMNDSILPAPSSPKSSLSEAKSSKIKSGDKLESPATAEAQPPSSKSKVKGKANKGRRPITAMMRRNTHILLHWFLQKFGNFPWWAELHY